MYVPPPDSGWWLVRTAQGQPQAALMASVNGIGSDHTIVGFTYAPAEVLLHVGPGVAPVAGAPVPLSPIAPRRRR